MVQQVPTIGHMPCSSNRLAEGGGRGGGVKICKRINNSPDKSGETVVLSGGEGPQHGLLGLHGGDHDAEDGVGAGDPHHQRDTLVQHVRVVTQRNAIRRLKTKDDLGRE
jgi:hypothetical protein